jgi:hypothetical protein
MHSTMLAHAASPAHAEIWGQQSASMHAAHAASTLGLWGPRIGTVATAAHMLPASPPEASPVVEGGAGWVDPHAPHASVTKLAQATRRMNRREDIVEAYKQRLVEARRSSPLPLVVL